MKLIVAAMESECSYLIDILGLEKTDKNIYKKDDIVLVNCGVGKVNAAMGCQKGFDLFDVDSVFNFGFVGSMSPDYRIGDYVFPSQTFQHDFDLTPLGYKPYEVSDQEKSVFDIEKYEELKKFFPELKKSQFLLTGDRFMTEKLPDFEDAICDMEGYAVARVAFEYNVPVTMVKLVSDSCVKEGQAEFFASVEKYRKDMQTKIAEYIKSL